MKPPPVNPYAKNRAPSAQPRPPTSVPKVAPKVAPKSENNINAAKGPLTAASTGTSIKAIVTPAVALPRPVDKKAQLKKDLADLKRANEAKKKQLELEKQRRKEEKRKRKKEALLRAQCEKEGIEYKPPSEGGIVNSETADPVSTTSGSPSETQVKNELVTPSPHLLKAQQQQQTGSTSSSNETRPNEAASNLASNVLLRNAALDIHRPGMSLPHMSYGVHELPPALLQQPSGFSRNFFPQQHSSIPITWPHQFTHHQYRPPPFGAFPTVMPQFQTPWGSLFPQHQQHPSMPYTYNPALMFGLQRSPDPVNHMRPNTPHHPLSFSQPSQLQPALNTKSQASNMTVAQQPAVGTSMTPAVQPTLAVSPLQSPSPFSKSHYLFPKPIIIIKRPSDASFGVTLKTNRKRGDSSNATDDEWYCAMSVEKAVDQNARQDPTLVAEKQLLHPDDLILAINNKSTEGLTFEQAVQLIRDCVVAAGAGVVDSSIEAKTVQCSLTVARRKVVTPLSPVEMGAFASCMIKALVGPKRICGSAEVANDGLELDAILSSRNLEQLRYEWDRNLTLLQASINVQATKHWEAQWVDETPAIQSLKCLTDADRSLLRSAPKPAKGCKCGALNHDFVDDVQCPLYSNLRRLSSKSYENAMPSMDEEMKRVNTKLATKDLNVVEKAFKDRFVRETVERKRDELEAAFVSDMEDIQLKKLKQAIRSPMLAAMVLSTVIELYPEFQDAKTTDIMYIETKANDHASDATSGNDNVGVEVDNEDDDEDDDVPLTALGKRSGNSTVLNTLKRSRKEAYIRPKFLARLLHVISHKWGHLYREPDHAEYAWRWELFHGENTTTAGSSLELYARNPRLPGTLSMENVRFVLDRRITSLFESPNETERATALNVLSVVASPSVSGVCDELLALCTSKVLQVDECGIPTPTKDWWANVDVLMLEDMHEYWGSHTDPRGLHGVSNKVRKTLGRRWRRTSQGWALGDDQRKVIYRFEQFEEWRQTLEGKLQAQANIVQGIGRFGI